MTAPGPRETRIANDCQRALSMQFVCAECQCPVCGGRWMEHIEVEHVQSLDAWMIDGALAITCPACKYKRSKRMPRLAKWDRKGKNDYLLSLIANSL